MPRLASLTSQLLLGTITYTSPETEPEYLGISLAPTITNEGTTITATVTTLRVTDGVTVGYTVTGVSSGDLSSGSLTGTITINSNTGSATFGIANDGLTEGTDVFTITLAATDSAGTSTLSASASALVNDTSNDPTTALWLDNNDNPTTVRLIIGATSMQINGVFASNPSVPRTIEGRTSGTRTTITAITARTGTYIEVDDTGNSTNFIVGEGLNLVLAPITVLSSYVTGTSASSAQTRAGITQSISFSGTQTQSLIAATNAAFATYPVTVEAWVYSSVSAGSILNLQNTSTGQNAVFFNNGVSQSNRTAAVASQINGTAWATGSWQHIAYTLWSTTGSTTVADRISVFVNGVANNVTNGGQMILGTDPDNYTATNQTRIPLGRNQFGLASSNNPFTGFISEIRVSNTARYGTVNGSPVFTPNVNTAFEVDISTLALIRAV